MSPSCTRRASPNAAQSHWTGAFTRRTPYLNRSRTVSHECGDRASDARDAGRPWTDPRGPLPHLIGPFREGPEIPPSALRRGAHLRRRTGRLSRHHGPPRPGVQDLPPRRRIPHGQRLLRPVLARPTPGRNRIRLEPPSVPGGDPILAFKDLWPALATHDVAAGLVSAIASAAAVYQVGAALREWGVGRAPSLILLLGFGLNPMIVYYAGNGMSDALYVFTLVATTRYLLRWLRQDDLRSLVVRSRLPRGGIPRSQRGRGVRSPGGSVGLRGDVLSGQEHGSARLMDALTDCIVFLLPIAGDLRGLGRGQLRHHAAALRPVHIAIRHDGPARRQLASLFAVRPYPPRRQLHRVPRPIPADRRTPRRRGVDQAARCSACWRPWPCWAEASPSTSSASSPTALIPFIATSWPPVPLDIFLIGCVVARSRGPLPASRDERFVNGLFRQRSWKSVGSGGSSPSSPSSPRSRRLRSACSPRRTFKAPRRWSLGTLSCPILTWHSDSSLTTTRTSSRSTPISTACISLMGLSWLTLSGSAPRRS